ncbi:MAG: FRG domain-containing protein [Clostridia bacterium]|nr:FRG domain-containing protein [Clostridia bacterium]
MIKVVRITKVEELMMLIGEQNYREDIGRHRSMYVYRGVPDADYRMTTSLYRNCKHLQKTLEPAILNNFKKYAVIDDPSVEQSVWMQMILGQHYGLPTRLLDWSHSALVALHFAATEADMDKMEDHDCAVWRIDMTEIHSLLPPRYQKALSESTTSIFSVKTLSSVTESLEQYDMDMRGDSMVVVEPPSIEQRIVNQYSFLSIVPMGMPDVEQFLDDKTSNTVKYVIDGKLRWRLRDMLDQLNISERIVYPGLEGLSSWIARHYFVKKREDQTP